MQQVLVHGRGHPYLDGDSLDHSAPLVRNAGECSLLTLIVYLNDNFGGGRTAFLDFDLEAIPRAGTALVFQHLLLHEGCTVTSGVKYAMRSDVMYRR